MSGLGGEAKEMTTARWLHFEQPSAMVMGSLEDLMSDSIDREKLRTIRSTLLTREIRFKR